MSVEKILSKFARQVANNSTMEFDDAYQELAIKELQCRKSFRWDFVAKNGQWVTYNTYLTSSLQGYSKKLIAKDLKTRMDSLDALLSYSEEDDSGSSSNQRYIAFDEQKYSRTEWNVVIEQLAVDDIDKFIMNKLMEGWTQSEIADLLDYSGAAVKQRLNRYKTKMTGFGEEEVGLYDADWGYDWDDEIPQVAS